MYTRSGNNFRRTTINQPGTTTRGVIDDGDAWRLRSVDKMTWDEIVDELEITRPGKRQDLLQGILNTLTTDYVPDKLVSRKHALLSVLGSSIRKGYPGESSLATECLNCVLVTLGTYALSTNEYEDLEKCLHSAFVDKRNGELRRGACWSYGILAFFGCADEGKLEDAEEWFREASLSIAQDMDSDEEFESGLLNNATASCEASLSDKQVARDQYIEGFLWGWGILVTQWDTDVLAEWDVSPTEDLLDCVLRCLSLGEGSIKILAPACILLAVLLEARWHKSLSAIVSGSLDRQGGRAAVVSELESRYKYVMESIRSLSDYSCQRRHSRSKEAWRAEKELLRMVQRTAETGEGPSESLCLGSRARATSFNTWIAYLRYEVFREVLKGSTAAHLMSNKSLMDCVAFNTHRRNSLVGRDHVTEEDLVLHSEAERRIREDVGKYRSQDRDTQRRVKQNIRLVGDVDVRLTSRP